MYGLITTVRRVPFSPVALSRIVEPEVVYILPDLGLVFYRLGKGGTEEPKGFSR